VTSPAGSRRAVAGFVGLVSVVLATNCSVLPFRKKSQPEVMITTSTGTMPAAALRSEVLRFADSYVAAVADAADQSAAKIGTRDAQVAALHWKINQATSAYLDATGENPLVNALDLLVLASVSRMVVEAGGAGEGLGAMPEPLVTEHRDLEAMAWNLADQFLTPDQRQELQNLIQEWRKKNPTDRNVATARFRDFALELGKISQPGNIRPTSIFSMLYIDPLAGLSPTTVAIQQSRELAERTVSYAERAPTLLRWQAELLALQIGGQPDAQQVMADVQRASLSISEVAKTVQGVPELVDAQRKAAIDQFFAGVAAERSAILSDMASQESRFRDLLSQLQLTMNAGGQMGTSLTETIRSLDAFVRYASPPTPPNAPPAKPGKPFDPLDYGKAASDVGGMARDLNAFLLSAERTSPKLEAISKKAGTDLKDVIDHAFWRGLILIVVLLVGSIPVRLAYRALARRIGQPDVASR
jgi:hypothetical protein